MRQMHQQMGQIQTQARTQMLAALTPSHRALLASIAGRLAVAATPDYRAASQQLEAALSATEKQTILTAEKNSRAQMRTLMQQARAQMPSPPPGASPRPHFGSPGARPGGPRRQADAGTVLLRHALRSSPMGFRRPA